MTEKIGHGSFNYSLNGFRGLCCGMVLLGHLAVISEHQSLVSPVIFDIFKPYIAPLGRGVELFFMISGFLIPASLRRHGDVGRFLADRAFRIMPVFVVIHLLVFIIGPLLHYKWMENISQIQYVEYFMANLLLVQDILGLPIAQQNAWSLTYESAFYLVAAGFYVVSIARLGATKFILMALVSVFMVMDPRFIYFLLGYICSLWLYSPRLSRAAKNAIILLLLVTFLYSVHYVGEAAGAVPALALFILVLSGNTFFDHMVFQFTGNIGYSLYLWHPVMVLCAAKTVQHFQKTGAAAPAFLILYLGLGVTLSLVVSAGSYYLIEKRLTSLLRGAFRRSAEQSASPPRIALRP